MERISRTVTRAVTLTCALVLGLLLAAPAWAAENGAEGGGKIQLPSTPRDRVGVFLIVAMVIAGALALWNARKQLRGDRKQASGEFRWR